MDFLPVGIAKNLVSLLWHPKIDSFLQKCPYDMNTVKALIISLAVVSVSGQPFYNRYGQYISYFIRGFTPPRSFFEIRPFYFDPTRGDAYQSAFQEAYGKYGDKLVRAYGQGFSKKVLLQHGLL